MKAESVIYERLSTHSGVTAYVGAGPAARVHPTVLPQGVQLPAIVYRRISSRRVQGVHSDPGYAYVTLQITCYAETFATVAALAEQVRVALERYGSAVTGTSIAGVTVYDIEFGSEASTYEPELGIEAYSLDVTVLHAE